MDEENKNPTPKQPEEIETPPFQLTDEDKKNLVSLGYSDDDIAKIKSKEDLETAKSTSKKENTTPDNSEKKDTQHPKSEDKSKDGTEKTGDEEKKPLKVGEDNGEEKQPENDDKSWISKKANYYETLAKSGEIQNYEQDTTQPNVFCAKFNNSTIRYSSPDEVTVSKDAEFKAFDTICKDPDNKDRPIEFPENQSEAFYAKMYAACALNGNPMTGAVPEKINFDELKNSGLTPEQIQQVKDIYNKQHSPNNENKGEEKAITPPEELKKQIKEALNEQVEFTQLGKKVSLTGSGENAAIVAINGGTHEDIDRWKALNDKQSATKKFLAEQYRNNPDIVKEAMTESLKEREDNKDERQSLRQAQKETIEDSMTDEQKQARKEKLSERDKIMAARLGLTPEYTTKDKDGNMVKISKDEKTESLMKNRYKDKEGGYDAFAAQLKSRLGKGNE